MCRGCRRSRPRCPGHLEPPLSRVGKPPGAPCSHPAWRGASDTVAPHRGRGRCYRHVGPRPGWTSVDPAQPDETGSPGRRPRRSAGPPRSAPTAAATGRVPMSRRSPTRPPASPSTTPTPPSPTSPTTRRRNPRSGPACTEYGTAPLGARRPHLPRGDGEGPWTAVTPARGPLTRSRLGQPSVPVAGMKPPGTSFGATILVSPGYGVVQLCVWYHVRWFICAGFA